MLTSTGAHMHVDDREDVCREAQRANIYTVQAYKSSTNPLLSLRQTDTLMGELLDQMAMHEDWWPQQSKIEVLTGSSRTTRRQPSAPTNTCSLAGDGRVTLSRHTPVFLEGVHQKLGFPLKILLKSPSKSSFLRFSIEIRFLELQIAASCVAVVRKFIVL